MRLLKGLLLSAAAMVLLVAAVWLVSWAMATPKAERDALALVDAPRAHGERDGFADLWTVSYDVPPAERRRVLDEDVRHFAGLQAQYPPIQGATHAWRSAREDWPRLDEARGRDPAWCPSRETGCLERVRAAPDDYAGLLEQHALQLERAAALSEFDHFRNPFPPRYDVPLPEFQALTRLSTRAAWRFVHGDTDEALADACAGVSQGRTLIDAGDSLIGSMIGTAMVEGNATLLAEMLAELPRDHPLPAHCDTAFARPPDLAGGVCRTMLAEGRLATGAMRNHMTTEGLAAELASQGLPAWSARLFFDPERTVARGAPKFAWYCGAQARELIAQDRPLRDPTPPPSSWSLACASNAVGCILVDVAATAYANYGLRLQDADARLRTMAALLWLRGRGGAIDEVALAQLPLSSQSPARPLRLDTAAGTLGTALYEPPRGDGGDGTWSVPLPASRLQRGDVSP